ncbi:MAG TPA: tripartite tricarboxylate transporter substrate binding protein [Ramlibacter sp.]|nr:tripartite tricarboxylate transporter substrate binding protein [Ramlibacter sp.]
MANRRQALLGLTAAALGSAGVRAQGSFPDRPLKLVVPFPPGGIMDNIARPLAEEMGRRLGQSVVVENRGGAAGKIGAMGVLQAPPDGYTLLLANGSTHGTLPITDPTFDPVKTFAPLGVVATAPFVLAGHPGLGANNVKELIALAKSQPGKLSYATPGVGSASHFAGEQFKSMAGVFILHVPYRGLGPALQDVMAGTISLTFDSTILPHLRSGKLKAFAVTSRERWPVLPDVPSLHEAGLTGYDIVGWAGLAVSANTPADVQARLNDTLARVLASAELQEKMRTTGMSVGGGGPSGMAQLTTDSIARYRKVAETTKMRFE